MDAKKKPAKKAEEEVEEVADQTPEEATAAEEAVTASEDVTIEELPGGGTREYPTSKRRYS